MNTPRIQFASVILMLALGMGIFHPAGLVADTTPDDSDLNLIDTENTLSGGRCGTQIRFEQELLAMGYAPESSYPTCPAYGPCDDPGIRDLWTFESGGPLTTIQLALHVVAHDDGSNPFATPEEIQNAVDSVNLYFLNTGIQFEYTLDIILSSDWRALDESEIDPMKIATAVDPTRNLNIWITSTFFGYAFGTFPFSENALEPTGGIVIGQWHWGGNYSGLTHEIGHCLGLWHNFHGVNEVTQCGPCYESIESEDRDWLGDMCADTPPGPAWYECSDATGIDSCAGLPWGGTQPENIMSYSPIDCRTLFTLQQGARMRCWINDVLSGWVVTSEPCCVGRVGDANNSGDDEPTIGDISLMIDAKFVGDNCASQIVCVAEADVNQSGGLDPTCDDITIGDISALIDYLFIIGPETAILFDCF